MKFISALTTLEQERLETLMKSSPTYRVRQRAHAILLSARGYNIDSLADIFSTHRNTISEWLDAWVSESLEGLSDAPKPGRPRKLSTTEEQQLIEAVEQHPQRITEALAELKKRRASS